ncbi:hypothetical protein DACRYDRAFT_19961, partial [Dacryopinax primogenitus]
PPSRPTSPSHKSTPAPPIMDPTTIARISRRKLALAAMEASTRDSLELRRVVLIQGAMHAAANASAATHRPPSPPRAPLSPAPPQIVVSPPPPPPSPPEPQFQFPSFGLEELQAEERWFDAVLDELDQDMDEEDEVDHLITVHTVQESTDSSSDGTVSEAGSEGMDLEDLFYPPPPPYSLIPASAPPPEEHQESEPKAITFDASHPPPLPDSFAADAWDDYDDGSEKVSIATLFSDVDLSSGVSTTATLTISAAAVAAASSTQHQKPQKLERDYGSRKGMRSTMPPGYGMYPPISPYELVWPGRYDYDAVVY